MQQRYHGGEQRYHGNPETPQATVKTPQATVQTPQAVAEMPPAVAADFSLELQNDLLSLGKHCRREKLNALILKLCAQRPLTRQNLAALLHRDESNLKKLLKTLVGNRQLRYLYPEMVKHPKQAYVTNQQEERHE